MIPLQEGGTKRKGALVVPTRSRKFGEQQRLKYRRLPDADLVWKERRHTRGRAGVSRKSRMMLFPFFDGSEEETRPVPQALRPLQRLFPPAPVERLRA